MLLRRQRRGPCRSAITIALVLVASRAFAADLQPRTADAYRLYAQQARQAFEQRVTHIDGATPRRAGVVPARPVDRDGIIDAPGGLIHHWVGAAFLPGVTLERVLRVSKQYSALNDIYKEVISSRILEQDADRYRVLTRLRESGAGISAVLDVRTTVDYSYPDARSAIVRSSADEIRQVIDAGQADERLLPAGHDSGYLWRADTLTYFLASGGGVYIEAETIGLSRPFPPMLEWFIKPIARRIGRKSVETSLEEFLAAVTKAARASA